MQGTKTGEHTTLVLRSKNVFPNFQFYPKYLSFNRRLTRNSENRCHLYIIIEVLVATVCSDYW